MSWLNSVRNVIPFVVKKETPDNLWHKCKGCGQMIFTKELEDNLYVCPQCSHHERIGPKLRFAYTFDPGSHVELPTPKVAEDPLKFRALAAETQRNPYTSNVNPGMVFGNPFTDVERLIKEYGYEGLLNPNLSKPTAVMFNPVPVKRYADGGSVGTTGTALSPGFLNTKIKDILGL